MQVSVSIQITVINPETGKEEEWQLHGLGTGYGDKWECEMTSVTSNFGHEDFIDFVTQYGLDGSAVDPWYERMLEACAEAAMDEEDEDVEE